MVIKYFVFFFVSFIVFVKVIIIFMIIKYFFFVKFSIFVVIIFLGIIVIYFIIFMFIGKCGIIVCSVNYC